MTIKSGFSIEQHKSAGKTLKQIQRQLAELDDEIAKAYNHCHVQGIVAHISKIQCAVRDLRGRMDSELLSRNLFPATRASMPDFYFGDDE